MFLRILKTTWAWLDARLGISDLIVPMMTHRVPPDARWWYVFGSATLASFLLQVVTGVMLSFSYVPSSGDAYAALQHLSHDAPFGRFLRGLHYFGASAMVLMVGIHALQVFLFGAYKFPRELNWITGLLLMGLTLGMGFTGQILRWDQTAVWSVVVAAEQAGRAPLAGKWLARFILGGGNVGGATLSRFFALHVFVLPALILALVGAHLHLVLRNGISEPPKPDAPVDPTTYRQDYAALLEKTGRPFWPDAAWRDVVFAGGMIVVVVLCAFLYGPPELGKPPDPSIIHADPRPDWYLLWYFAVLALLPPAAENVFIVFAPLAVGVALLVLPLLFARGDRHFSRRPWAVASVLTLLVMVGALWRAGEGSDWSPDFAAKPISQKVVASTDPLVQHGAQLFFSKACIHCHRIGNDGGRRGPNLTDVSERLTQEQITIRILNGATNMPAFGNILKPQEMEALRAFLESRRRYVTSRQRAAESKTPGDK
ncbi:MAG: cytochrome b N-terminal domain-containing protein [Verrucomicrobiota bacterium]